MADRQKGRILTKAEKKRLERYQTISEELKDEGYVRKELTASVEKANTLGVLYGVILSLPFIILFVITLAGGTGGTVRFFSGLWFAPVLLVLIVVHELVHGITWSLFAEGGWKNIEFGVIWKMLTPYCTCGVPLRKGQYIAGSFMPCLVLGILPSLISCLVHDVSLFVIGIIMIISAGGDLLIIRMILAEKTGEDALYLDHPTDVGLAVFEKEKA